MSNYTTISAWPATLAVETARLGSAGLSASYYGMLGLVVPPVPVYGVSVPAAAIALGALAFALDYVKGAMLAIGLGGSGWGGMRRFAALVGGALLILASGIAIEGVIMKLRVSVASGPANVITEHDNVAGDLKAAKGELKALESAATTEQVRAAMDKAKVERRAWKDSKECTDFTAWRGMHRDACGPILELRVKMADAIRKGDLEAKRDGLQAKLDKLGPKPASADPQATALANVTGLSEAFILLLLTSALGVTLEFISSVGRYALDRPQPKTAAFKAPECPSESPASFRISRGAGRLDRPDGGASVRPKLPKPIKPDGPAARPDGRTDDLKGRVLAFVQTERAMGRSIPSQAHLLGRFPGLKRSTLSDWMGDWEEAGLIPKRIQIGRCKVIAGAKQKATA